MVFYLDFEGSLVHEDTSPLILGIWVSRKSLCIEAVLIHATFLGSAGWLFYIVFFTRSRHLPSLLLVFLLPLTSGLYSLIGYTEKDLYQKTCIILETHTKPIQ